MCDPLSLALMGGSMGLSAVGGGMKSKGAATDYANDLETETQRMRQDAAEAAERNEVLKAYLARSRGYAGENQSTFGREIQGFSPEAQRTMEDARVASRSGAVAKAIGTGANTPAVPLLPGSTSVSSDDLATRMKLAYQKAQEAGARHAKVGAIGETWQGNDENVAQAGNQIGTVNQISRGDMALLPQEQELAGFKHRKPITGKPRTNTGLGSLLQGLGSIGGAVAGGRMGGWSGGAPQPTALQLMPTDI